MAILGDPGCFHPCASGMCFGEEDTETVSTMVQPAQGFRSGKGAPTGCQNEPGSRGASGAGEVRRATLRGRYLDVGDQAGILLLIKERTIQKKDHKDHL